MPANGNLLPANEAPDHTPTRSGDGRASSEKAKPSNRVRLNGNIARRKPGKRGCEYWDIDLPGFGLRVNPGGRRTWFVLFRQRGKGDILFWRDSFVKRPGVFNRTLPVFSVMMGYTRSYAEAYSR